MTGAMDYGSWTLNHPVRAVLTVLAGAVFGGLAGVLAATWLSETARAISPGNVLAGAGLGFGGVLLGVAAAALVIAGAGRRNREPRRSLTRV